MAGSGSSSGNLGSLSVSKEDKGGKNKRKLADHPLQNLLTYPSSLIEFPAYESTLKKSQILQSDWKHFEVGFSQSDDWDDPLACQLEELLLFTIRTIYQNAVTLLVRKGYNEDASQKAVSRQGFYDRCTDIVETIVNDAESSLRNGKGNSRDIVFESMQEMVEYTLLELVNVLRQAKPSLSTGEVMWWLLICDMNISQACEMEEDILGEFNGKKNSSESSVSPKFRLKSQSSEFNLKTDKPTIANSSLPMDQSSTNETLKFGSFPNSQNLESASTTEKKSMLSVSGSSQKPSCVQPKSQALEKLRTGSKSLSKKELATLQKMLNAELVLRNQGKNLSHSGKIPSLCGVNLTKHGVQAKGSASKVKAKEEISPVDRSSPVPDNSLSITFASDGSSKVHIQEAISTTATETSEPVVSGKKSISKPETSTPMFPKIPDYCAAIPYDKFSGKCVREDEKDELVVKLVPRVQSLQDDLRGWTNWANQKVMQATRRLSKDKLELKALKQDKEEAEKIRKEKKIVEENAVKRQSDVEFALVKATSQFEAANTTIQNLEDERSMLKKEREKEKLQAEEKAKNYQEAYEREQKAKKEVQSIDKQKRLLEGELRTQKQKVVELQEEKGKAEKILNQIEARWNQERALKEAILAQFASMRHERSKVEAAWKIEEDMMRQRVDIDAKKYKEDISKLEKEISEIKLKSDASKIAALKKSMSGNFGAAGNQDANQNSDNAEMEVNFLETSKTKGLKQERECIMCLSEEKSMVFLPCAHQILCKNCNELHKKGGMDDCPACRTPIQLRFPARFVDQ